jgi:hypothetical protein
MKRQRFVKTIENGSVEDCDQIIMHGVLWGITGSDCSVDDKRTILDLDVGDSSPDWPQESRRTIELPHETPITVLTFLDN